MYIPGDITSGRFYIVTCTVAAKQDMNSFHFLAIGDNYIIKLLNPGRLTDCSPMVSRDKTVLRGVADGCAFAEQR